MARDRTRIRQEPMIAFGIPVYGGALIPTLGQDWFVDPNADVFVPKKKWGTGKSDDRPFRTLAEALAACNTHDRIYFTGNVREENLICSNLKFDVHLIGVGSQHHPDQPTSAYHPGAACIRPPASPTATTPLLVVRGRGWQFHNILFDCPVDASAIKLTRNALADASEYDASHAAIRNCDFRNGLYGIQDSGGCFNVRVFDSTFETLDATASAAALVATDPLNFIRRWQIVNNYFAPDGATAGNERHIVMGLNASLIRKNIFGTVKGTGLYVDLTGGAGNVVTENTCMGTWATADYKGGTGDSWVGNFTAVDASTSPVGYSIAVPD